ncbi:MAG: Cinorf13 protein [Pseudonocardiales bacterium]|nr:Cinorf13 protein [Pseudonocardiales bacterium]
MTFRDDVISEASRMVANVGLPDPFSVRAFLNQVAQTRGKPIVLHQVEPGWCVSGGWCGAWLDTGDADHIFFVQDTSTVKTSQTILHEVGHVLFDHPGQPVPANVPLGGMEVASVRRVRGRFAFDEIEELAAEAFSTLVLQSTMVGARGDLFVAADPRAALLEVRLG